MTAVTDSYFTALIGRLETLREALAEPMSQASAAICAAARADRRVYVFGTGHSHMLAEEVHYRAGGHVPRALEARWGYFRAPRRQRYIPTPDRRHQNEERSDSKTFYLGARVCCAST